MWDQSGGKLNRIGKLYMICKLDLNSWCYFFVLGDFGNSMAGGFFTGTPGGSQPTPGEKKVLTHYLILHIW